MSVKRFIPCIYLSDSACVSSLSEAEVINDDPLNLALFYEESGADELLIFDLSRNEEDKKKHLSIIKEIAGRIQIPLIGAGNVSTLEDIKMLLYSGCRKASLNYARESNIALSASVSKKFGRDKIIASIGNKDEITANEKILSDHISEIIIIDEHIIRAASEISKLPLILHIPKISLDKIIELLRVPVNVGITGNAINRNANNLIKIKDLCRENKITLSEFAPALNFKDLKQNSDGLVPVIVQEYGSDEVLMLAYMNEEAFNSTMKSGRMTYFSRSRQEIWIKGESSGHYQYLRSLAADCDYDTILAKVTQVGAACHTGTHNCFFNPIIELRGEEIKIPGKILESLMSIINDRKKNPREGSYTNYLFDKGIDKILKKLGEEACEIIIAAKNPNNNEIKYEIADYLYHLMVLMAEKEVGWDDIMDELAKR